MRGLQGRAPALLPLLVLLLPGPGSAQKDPDAALTAIRWNDNHEAAGRLEDGVLHLDLEVRRGLWRP